MTQNTDADEFCYQRSTSIGNLFHDNVDPSQDDDVQVVGTKVESALLGKAAVAPERRLRSDRSVKPLEASMPTLRKNMAPEHDQRIKVGPVPCTDRPSETNRTQVTGRNVETGATQLIYRGYIREDSSS